MINNTVVTYLRLPLNIPNEHDRKRLEQIVTRIWRDQRIYEMYDEWRAKGKSHTWTAQEISYEMDMSISHVNSCLANSGRKARKTTPALLKAIG